MQHNCGVIQIPQNDMLYCIKQLYTQFKNWLWWLFYHRYRGILAFPITVSFSAVNQSAVWKPRRNGGLNTTHWRDHYCRYNNTTGIKSLFFIWPTIHQNAQISTLNFRNFWAAPHVPFRGRPTAPFPRPYYPNSQHKNRSFASANRSW